MKLPQFAYRRPDTVEQALALLAESGDRDVRLIAGGQSLLPVLAFRLSAPDLLVDIGRIEALKRLEIGPSGIVLGAGLRWRDVLTSPDLGRAHPLLVAAVRQVAHYQVRNRGTLGGSLAHADPAAELPGIALACGGEIVAAGPRGERRIAAEAFFDGPLSTVLEDDEMILALHLPSWPAGRRWAFREFARRQGDFALAGVALHYDLDGDGRVSAPRIGAIGVSDRPVRLAEVERAIDGARPGRALAEAAGRRASQSAAPEDDIHAKGEYRRALLGVLVERALAEAAGLADESEAAA